MRKKWKLGFASGDCVSKMCRRGCGGVYDGVWRSLLFARVWIHVVDSVLVPSAGIWLQSRVKVFSHLTYFKIKFDTFGTVKAIYKIMLK
jgi:hypothetical protein